MNLMLGNEAPVQQADAYPDLVAGSKDFKSAVATEEASQRISTQVWNDAGVVDAEGGVWTEESAVAPARADDELLLARLKALKNPSPLGGRQVTVIGDLPDDWDAALVEMKPHMPYHFADGAGPSWVDCSDPDFAQILSRKWKCPVGKPDGWEVG